MATPPLSKDRKKASSMTQLKWATALALPVLAGTIFVGIYALWGLLFIYWAYLSIRNGQAFLIEDIDAKENPLLFWAINLLWIGSGLLYIFVDFFPA